MLIAPADSPKTVTLPGVTARGRDVVLTHAKPDSSPPASGVGEHQLDPMRLSGERGELRCPSRGTPSPVHQVAPRRVTRVFHRLGDNRQSGGLIGPRALHPTAAMRASRPSPRHVPLRDATQLPSAKNSMRGFHNVVYQEPCPPGRVLHAHPHNKPRAAIRQLVALTIHQARRCKSKRLRLLTGPVHSARPSNRAGGLGGGEPKTVVRYCRFL